MTSRPGCGSTSTANSFPPQDLGFNNQLEQEDDNDSQLVSARSLLYGPVHPMLLSSISYNDLLVSCSKKMTMTASLGIGQGCPFSCQIPIKFCAVCTLFVTLLNYIRHDIMEQIFFFL